MESAIDKLAAELGMHPVTLRLANALQTGDLLPTGQVVRRTDAHARAPRVRAAASAARGARRRGLRPASASRWARQLHPRRGTAAWRRVRDRDEEAIGFSGGVDDTSTARVSVVALGDRAVAEVYSAAAECGQGIVTVQAQIVRTELSLHEVVVRQADTLIADAGSSSASRQTWMTGGAVLRR
ncbi:MAG: molybdopterin cofactor-binding domain-containing protein [Ilumatobacteraceae bacterium]